MLIYILHFIDDLFIPSLQVTKEELAKLVQGFDKTDILTSGGVTLAGQRHIYLSGTDRVVRAKLGKIGVHCMKTQQGMHYSFGSKLMNRPFYGSKCLNFGCFHV